mgnify:CR=1 FL=1
MKNNPIKLLVVLIILLSPTILKAQFVITPNGLSTEDNKDYIVITVEGKDKDTLYQEVLKYITKTYVSAKDVVSPVEGEMISINGIFQVKEVLVNYDVNYTINLEFRDGRIKYSLPQINYMIGYYDSKEYQLTYNTSNGGLGSVVLVGIYNKKGKVKRKGAKTTIEVFFNDSFNSLQDYLSSTEEDW